MNKILLLKMSLVEIIYLSHQFWLSIEVSQHVINFIKNEWIILLPVINFVVVTGHFLSIKNKISNSCNKMFFKITHYFHNKLGHHY